METGDDDKQGSSLAAAEIPTDDGVNTDRRYVNDDSQQADDYSIAMETDDQDSLLPLDLICPMTENMIGAELTNRLADAEEEEEVGHQSSPCEQDEEENNHNNEEGVLSEDEQNQDGDFDTGRDVDGALNMAGDGDEGQESDSIDNLNVGQLSEDNEENSGQEDDVPDEEGANFEETHTDNDGDMDIGGNDEMGGLEEGQYVGHDEGQDEGQDESQDEGQDEGQDKGQDESQDRGQDEGQGEGQDEAIMDNENIDRLEKECHDERDIVDNGEEVEEAREDVNEPSDLDNCDVVDQRELEEACDDDGIPHDSVNEPLDLDHSDAVDRTSNSTPDFTAILSNSSSPVPVSVEDDQHSQYSQLSQERDHSSAKESCSEGECSIQLDAETFDEWRARKKSLRFKTDVQMAKFLMQRLAVHGFDESGESSQVTPTESCSKTNGAQKKKSIPATTGGIESIVRRLHQERIETPPPRSPATDCDSEDNRGDEEMCNIDNADADEVSIPKKAYTSIYSTGRVGRKRVFVQRGPGTDGFGSQINQQDQLAYENSCVNPQEQGFNVSSNEQPWPVRIKQEPIDEEDLDAQIDEPNKEDELLSGSPGSLGRFVRNAASWVSSLVASELEKPPKKATPPPAYQEESQNLFSESRLHKIIEQQLSKAPEPTENQRLHTMIAEQLAKPDKGIDKIPQIKVEPNDDYGTQFVDSKAARKEQKKARKEARQAKKLKKALKREKVAPNKRNSNQVYNSSSSERSSPYDKSSSPYNKSYSLLEQSSSPASSCLESFARMVQIREFQGGGSQQAPAPPPSSSTPHVPTGQGLTTAPYSPKTVSPTPSGDKSVQQASPAEHPASLALKSFAQRSVVVVPAQPKNDAKSPYLQQADAPISGHQTSKGSPLEKLLQVSENPPKSAKSQLEHLLKSKDIKSKWATPGTSSPNTVQTFPYNLTQANVESKYLSSHILKVPKVPFSGRSSYDSDQEQYLKDPSIDRILAMAGISSDSEDSDNKESKDPDWNPYPATPTKRAATRRYRKRSLPRNVYPDYSNEMQTGAAAYSFADNMVVADKENGEPSIGYEQAPKHPRLGQDGLTQDINDGGQTEMSATNTLAKLLQMAHKTQPGTNVPTITSQSSSKIMPSVPNNGHDLQNYNEQSDQSPKRDFTAKQSAVGVMQAFAQLVEIQGISPNGKTLLKNDSKAATHTEGSSMLLSKSLPYLTPDGSKSNNPSSLPDGMEYRKYSGTHPVSGRNAPDQNGADDGHKDHANGNNRDEPEDLTVYSKIKIKVEPQDDIEPTDYRCSLCSKSFHSKTEVTEHKMIVHYSSGCEMVS